MYIVSSCAANIGQGLVGTVIGPTQLYLAKNVNVDIDVINLVWTCGFLGYFVGSLLSGFSFRR